MQTAASIRAHGITCVESVGKGNELKLLAVLCVIKSSVSGPEVSCLLPTSLKQ